MAKYDTYTLSVQLGKEEARANLTLTVLFEEGDVEADVIANVRETIQLEAIEIKETEFLKSIEP